jgi:hypothetical protein
MPRFHTKTKREKNRRLEGGVAPNTSSLQISHSRHLPWSRRCFFPPPEPTSSPKKQKNTRAAAQTRSHQITDLSPLSCKYKTLSRKEKHTNAHTQRKAIRKVDRFRFSFLVAPKERKKEWSSIKTATTIRRKNQNGVIQTEDVQGPAPISCQTRADQIWAAERKEEKKCYNVRGSNALFLFFSRNKACCLRAFNSWGANFLVTSLTSNIAGVRSWHLIVEWNESTWAVNQMTDPPQSRLRWEWVECMQEPKLPVAGASTGNRNSQFHHPRAQAPTIILPLSDAEFTSRRSPVPS